MTVVVNQKPPGKVSITKDSERVVVTEPTEDVVTVRAGIRGEQGIPGPQGPQGPAGPGVPTGGAVNDILAKTGTGNYQTGWTDTPTVDGLKFDIAANETIVQEGEVVWDAGEGTLSIGMNGGVEGRVTEHSFYRVQAVEAITKGNLVMAVGTVGASGIITVAKARPTYLGNPMPSQRLMGLAAANISQGSQGYVIHFGKLRKVNTLAFQEGDILYADPTVAGGLTATQPAAPNWKTIVALVVTRHQNNGEFFIRPTFGSQLTNDEAVTLTSPATGDVLSFTGTVWENASLADYSKSVIEERTYTHIQGVSSSTWTITHNLDRKPTVTVIDSGGEQVFGDVTYHSDNVITLVFSAPFSGIANLL